MVELVEHAEQPVAQATHFLVTVSRKVPVVHAAHVPSVLIPWVVASVQTEQVVASLQVLQLALQSMHTLEVASTNCDAVQGPHLLAVSPSVPVQAAHAPSALIPSVSFAHDVQVMASLHVAHPVPQAVQVVVP